MATLASFDDMLLDHLHYDLLWEELRKRTWLLDNVKKNTKWKGGTLPVPFKGARASSYKMGGLTDEEDVSDNEFVLGTVDDYRECWGTLKFRAKDLHQHVPEGAKAKGLVNKQSFLQSVPDMLEDFIDGMKDTVSTMLLTGAHFAKLTVDSTANDGVVEIDRIDRLQLGQKVIVDDDNSTAITGFVKSINVNANTAVLVTARGGSTVIDFSANNMTVAQNAKLYIDGAETSANVFTSLRSQLLPASLGGSANLFGKSKLAYPYLQAPAIDGSTMTATNILEVIFDAWTRILTIGKGKSTHVVMSFKHLGSVFKKLETGSGAYRHIETKVNPYGYTEVVIGGVKGQLTLVGIQEMEDDCLFFVDKSAITLHSNGFFERHIDANGNGFYIKRATTGYTYYVDVRFYGELVVDRPGNCGVIYSVDY
jgi:hypothetical protein